MTAKVGSHTRATLRGSRRVGVHGTNEPWLIPGNISHGCIRLHNRDILRLDRLMPVGTPVTIR